jgi:hypothetical protein
MPALRRASAFRKALGVEIRLEERGDLPHRSADNNAAEPYQKWSFTIDRIPVKVGPGESEVSEFCARLGTFGRATTFFPARN